MYQQSQNIITNSTVQHPSYLVQAPKWQANVSLNLSDTFNKENINLISDIVSTNLNNEYYFTYHVHTALEAAALRRAILSYVEVYAPHSLTIEHFTSALLPDELVHRISLLPIDKIKFDQLRANNKLPTKGELDNTLLDINHPQHHIARDIDLIIDVSAASRKHISVDMLQQLPATYNFPPCYFNSDHITNSPFITNNIMPMRGEIVYKNETLKEADCVYGILTLRPGIGLYGLKYQTVCTCIALPLKPVANNDPLAVSDGFYRFRIRLIGSLDLEQILTAALKAVKVDEDNTHLLFPLNK